MKITSLGLLAALILIGCSDNKKEGNLEITGNIKGLNKGTIYIQKVEDTTLVLMDSISISGDSYFSSTLQIDSPEMLYIFLDRGTSNTIDNNLPFFAEPGKMNIDTRLETFYAEAKITGSKNHDLFEEYKKVKSRFVNQEMELTSEKLNAFKNKTALPEDYQSKVDAVTKRKYLHAINFALTNKDYEIAPYIALAEIPDANVKYLDTIQKSMAPKVANSKYGKLLTSYVADLKKKD